MHVSSATQVLVQGTKFTLIYKVQEPQLIPPYSLPSTQTNHLFSASLVQVPIAHPPIQLLVELTDKNTFFQYFIQYQSYHIYILRSPSPAATEYMHVIPATTQVSLLYKGCPKLQQLNTHTRAHTNTYTYTHDLPSYNAFGFYASHLN